MSETTRMHHTIEGLSDLVEALKARQPPAEEVEDMAALLGCEPDLGAIYTAFVEHMGELQPVLQVLHRLQLGAEDLPILNRLQLAARDLLTLKKIPQEQVEVGHWTAAWSNLESIVSEFEEIHGPVVDYDAPVADHTER